MEPFPVFVRFDYTETKEILRMFFTLVASILVLSTTFAEKIVDVRNTTGRTVEYMIACWALLIISLVLSGISLIFITLAASKSIYTHAPYLNFLSQTTMSHISWLSAIIAGTFFAGALSLMVLATQRSIRNKHTEAMSEIK